MTISAFVGVDWGSMSHQTCVLLPDRTVVGEKAFEHSGKGLVGLADWVVGLVGRPAAEIAVAIEVPNGPVVSFLLMREFQVFSINPKQLDRFRGRFTVAGAKDDRRDALVLANSLRTDPSAFRAIALEQPDALTLQELVRIHDVLHEQLLRLSSQLREQLWRYFPQVLQLSGAMTDPWVWALLEKCPTPQEVDRLRPLAVAKILERHRIGRLSATEVLAVLRQPSVVMRADLPESLSLMVKALLPQIQLVKQTLMEQEKAMKVILRRACKATPDDRPSDAAILSSLPGVGTAVLSRLLAYGAESVRNRNGIQLRAQAGVAPVTIQSGKSCRVSMRRACNPHLRFALYHWGFGAMQRDPFAHSHYAALRAKGKTHARAVRGVADRLINVAMAMLKTGTRYQASIRKEHPANASGPTTS